MAIMINPNAIQKGSITKEMLAQGARKPIILTPSTTEVDEETYQKLLSDDVDVMFKTQDEDANLCLLTYKTNSETCLKLFFTCLSVEGSTIDTSYLYAYEVDIAKTSPHTCSITENQSGEFESFFDSRYLIKSTLSPVLQGIVLAGTDEERKAKLDKFEADWKALTDRDDLTGARFVGIVTDENTPPAKCVFTYDGNNNAYWGLSAGSEDDDIVRKIYVDCVDGSLYITPLFSHLEPVEIFTDNSAASKQKNLDNLNAYKSNLAELGVDTNKSFQVPFREGDKATFIGTLQYSVDTNTYIGVGCASDEDTARIIRISSTGESTITNLALADSLSRILRDFGMYANPTEYVLAVGVSGKYIDKDSALEVANGNYSISQPISLKAGDILLVPSTSAVAAACSVVSKKVTNTYDKVIIYAYTYDEFGRINTATADYNTSLVYTAYYESDKQTTPTNWIRGGEHITELPETHEVTESFYEPLVKQSVAGMPETGYYVYLASQAMDVVVSAYNATINGGHAIIAGWGIFKNVATNFVGIDKQRVIAEAIAALFAQVEGINEKLTNGLDRLSVKHLHIDRELSGLNIAGTFCLQGAGVPSASVVPVNWDFRRYGDWKGIPQFIGQEYFDTTNKVFYKAHGVTAISDWKRITNA